MSSLSIQRCTALPLCALLFLALGPFTARAQQQPGDTPDDLYSLSVQEGLSRAVNRQIGPLEAFPFLKRAAQSKDPAPIGTLKELAIRYANDDDLSRYQEGVEYSGVAHTAMYALWKKGVPRSYFLNLARQYEQDPWPAFYAATILATHPDAETMALLEEMKRRFSGGYGHGIYGTARYVRAQFESYEQMATPEEKADFLIKWAGRGFQALGHGRIAWSESRHLHPASVRAREELLPFSQEHPAVVARQLASVKLEYGNTRQYQRHVAQYLSEEAQRLLETMQ